MATALKGDLFSDSWPTEGLAGVDEVGRGPLAGDVVAAAVILDPRQPIEGLDDSKKLTADQRQALAIETKNRLTDSLTRAPIFNRRTRIVPH